MPDPSAAPTTSKQALASGKLRVATVTGATQRDWYVHEWMLLAFAAGMMLLIYFVAQHEQEFEKAEIIRDAAVVEQSISRRLENDQQFFDRLALDVGGERISPEEFDRVASKRAVESGYVTDIMRVTPELDVVQHAPGSRSLEMVLRGRAPFADQVWMTGLTRKTSRSTYSQPYRNDLGRYYIEYAAPVVAQGDFVGTINSVISFDALLEKAAPEWAGRKYRAVISDASGQGMTNAEAMHIESGVVKHTVPLSLPWRDLQLTLVGAKPSTLLPNLTLSTAVLALTGLMVWTSIGLRKQQRMRKQAEVERDRTYAQSIADLRVTNERFETVLDSLDVSVYVSDLRSNELLYANSHLHETFPAIEIGRDARQFEDGFLDSPSNRFPAPMLLTREGEPGDVFKDELEHSDHRHFLMRTRAVRWVDGRIARLTTLGDITDRVNAERIRQTQQDKLTRTSRLMTVGEIASTLAHEINQPLAAIANYVNGCIRRLKNNGNVDQAVIGAMEKADAQVARAGAIIGRVREFVRTREPQRQPLDVNALVIEVVKLAQSDDEQRALTCELRLARDLPLVFADRIMIEQVLLNFLRNAREAMQHLAPAQRIAEIRTTRVDGSHAMVEVADRGVGISPEAARQLFSPFFSTKNDGMGMGLNICRSLIEYHEGNLTFGQNEPCGAVFRFTLPFDHSAEHAADHPQDQPQARPPAENERDGAHA
ncbi:MAG: ATP-binding protein [Burkholderiales bacterium]